MSDVEFFAKLNPKPFKSVAIEEKERIEAIKNAKLKVSIKLPKEPKPEWIREPFVD